MNDRDDTQLSWSNSSSQKPQAPAAAPQPLSAEKNTIPAAKLAGWIAAGIVAGVVIAWSASSVIKGGTIVMPATTNATTTQQNGSSATGTLAVMTPQKAGRSVAIQGAIVTAPTWIVVYESRNGMPGNVLGAALFFPERPMGTVELLRGTVAGQTYFVTKRSDNGDRRFSMRADPLLKEEGEEVWTTFTAN